MIFPCNSRNVRNSKFNEMHMELCHHSLEFQWLKYTNVPIYSEEIWHELWCFNDNFMHFVEYSLIFRYWNFTETLFFAQCSMHNGSVSTATNKIELTYLHNLHAYYYWDHFYLYISSNFSSWQVEGNALLTIQLLCL